jgi:nitrogen fixation-related uncharacterized protein
MVLIVVVAAVAFLGLAAQTWGVDSRPFDVDPAHPTRVGLG